MSDGIDFSAIAEEPSLADFEAPEDELPEVGPKVAIRRALRTAGVLLVVVALLFYFVVPFNNVFSSVPFRWRPSGGMHPIPLAPGPSESTTLPA